MSEYMVNFYLCYDASFLLLLPPLPPFRVLIHLLVLFVGDVRFFALCGWSLLLYF